MRRVGAILVAGLVSAVAAATPVLGQSVLHAGLLYNSVRPMDYSFDSIAGSPQAADGPFIRECVLAIGDKACVDAWRLKGRAPQRQGMRVRNMTHATIRVRLQGCEIHNGAQTIVIDDKGLWRNRSPQDGPFDEKIMPGDLFGLDFIHPAGGSTFPLAGMRPFREGVTMTCRTATATAAP